MAKALGRGGWNRGKRWTPTEHDLKQIETMSGIGLSHEKIAAILKISRDVFEMTMKRLPALRQAMDEGKSKAEQTITRCAFTMAQTDPGMTRFWLQCRAKWTPTTATHVSGPDGAPIQTQAIDQTPEEQKLRIAKFQRIMNETDGS